MGRQYFETLDFIDPPSANLTAVTATVETGLWSTALWTPIPANDARAGKVYKVTAGGIVSTGASGTLTITPRFGTTTGGVTLGASQAQTVPVSLTNVPWIMEFYLTFRSIGTTASTSSAIGTGTFRSAGAAATAGNAWTVAFGGTAGTTLDTTTTQGIFIGWTLSVAGSVTPQYAFIQSLN